MAQLVEISIGPKAPPPSHEDFEAFFDAIADAFYECEGIFDQDVSGNADTGDIVFSLAIDTDDPAEALQRALGAVRTAMHAAGGRTPGWEQRIEEALSQISGTKTTAAPELAAA